MKAKFCFGILGMSLLLAVPAFADDDDDDGYDEGTDAAHNFCTDLRAPRETFGHGEEENITEKFSRSCKRGFDDYVNHNRSCKKRIKQEGASREMWAARRSACE